MTQCADDVTAVSLAADRRGPIARNTLHGAIVRVWTDGQTGRQTDRQRRSKWGYQYNTNSSTLTQEVVVSIQVC